MNNKMIVKLVGMDLTKLITYDPGYDALLEKYNDDHLKARKEGIKIASNKFYNFIRNLEGFEDFEIEKSYKYLKNEAYIKLEITVKKEVIYRYMLTIPDEIRLLKAQVNNIHAKLYEKNIIDFDVII